MGYISGEDRNQIYWLLETVNDSVGEDNPVRFLAAFVDKLDLGDLGFQHATPADRWGGPLAGSSAS
jgi:transposase